MGVIGMNQVARGKGVPIWLREVTSLPAPAVPHPMT